MSFGGRLPSSGFAKRRREVDHVVFWKLDRITKDRVDSIVGAECEIVSPVSDPTGKVSDARGGLEATIAIRVVKSIKALCIVGLGIQGTIGVDQPATFRQRVIDGFDLGDGSAVAGEGHSQQALVFASDRESSLRIEFHAHPRTLVLLGGTDSLDFETGTDEKLHRISDRTIVGCLSPLLVVVKRCDPRRSVGVPVFGGNGSERVRRLPRSRLLVDHAGLPIRAAANDLAPAIDRGDRQLEHDGRGSARTIAAKFKYFITGTKLVGQIEIKPGTVVVERQDRTTAESQFAASELACQSQLGTTDRTLDQERLS